MCLPQVRGRDCLVQLYEEVRTAGPGADAPRPDLRSAATSKIATAKFSSYTPIHLSRSVQNRGETVIAKRGSAALDIGQGGGG